ncbi:MAG: hypothetical protein ACTHKG_09970 [Nocardioides sp.]
MLNSLSVMAAHDRSTEMHRAAARRRLARLAACCRSTRLSGLVGRLRIEAAHRRAQRTQVLPGAVCCA